MGGGADPTPNPRIVGPKPFQCLPTKAGSGGRRCQRVTSSRPAKTAAQVQRSAIFASHMATVGIRCLSKWCKPTGRKPAGPGGSAYVQSGVGRLLDLGRRRFGRFLTLERIDRPKRPAQSSTRSLMAPATSALSAGLTPRASSSLANSLWVDRIVPGRHRPTPLLHPLLGAGNRDPQRRRSNACAARPVSWRRSSTSR